MIRTMTVLGMLVGLFLVSQTGALAQTPPTPYVREFSWVAENKKIREFSATLAEERGLEPLEILAKKLSIVEGYAAEKAEADNHLAPKVPQIFVEIDNASSTPIKYVNKVILEGNLAATSIYRVGYAKSPDASTLERIGKLVGEFDARQRGVWDQVNSDKMDCKVSVDPKKPTHITVTYSGGFWDFAKSLNAPAGS